MTIMIVITSDIISINGSDNANYNDYKSLWILINYYNDDISDGDEIKDW